ncbi:MAG: YIP1 family protein [Acidobacteriaceae bacterium]
MGEVIVGGSSVPEAQGLSQVERVVDTFVAPSKTFTDILRNTSWWVPFLLIVVLSLGFAYAVDKTVGYDAVAQQQVEKVHTVADQLDQMAPADRARMMHQRAVGTRYTTYAFGLLVLAILAIEALVLWASFNFGLGAKTTFKQVFAVLLYAGLPKMFVYVIAIALLFSGVGLDSFDIQNPAGTNLGYFMSNPTMKAAGSFFDVFGLWALALLVIGMAIISKKTKTQSAIIVVGWWLLGLIVSAGVAAAFS